MENEMIARAIVLGASALGAGTAMIAVSYLYDYIRSRLDHVRDRIDHPELYHHIRFINTAGRGEYRDSELWLRDGSRISDPIMEQMADRFYSDGFHFRNGTPFSNTRPVFSDMTLYSDE